MLIQSITNCKEFKDTLTTVSRKIDHEFEFLNDLSRPFELLADISKRKPSILILDDDYSKPETPEFLTAIRKVHNNIKIIFCTSNDRTEFGRTIISIGTDIYLMKPVDEEDITQTLNSVSNYIEKQT